MRDYKELISDLRDAEQVNWKRLSLDAAAAIEALQADIKWLKEANDELREAQTFIDHYGDRWMTSAKDVPNAAYEHGYADGRDEAEAQLPKRGEWIQKGAVGWPKWECSVCHSEGRGDYIRCPWCGAVMDESNASNASNALNALDNAQDGPIITPCRGCSDYYGYGGCKSKGGCARAKMEVQDGQK